MKSKTTSCPACGAPVEFHNPGSLVVVCEYCQSAVARGDKDPEDFGKVADLVETDSPIRQGTSGKFRDSHFTVAGRVQYKHPAGGVWDEWYLAFPGNRWGWLAEAQGKFYLTLERPLKSSQAPDFDSLEVGSRITIRDKEFAVAEKGTATALGAEGEIPWLFRPGAEHKFADLQGPNNAFATLDFGEDAIKLYLGVELTLDKLQLDHHDWHAPVTATVVPGKLLNCPQCGGQIELLAPDKSECVTCANCASLLDATEGKLRYLQTLKEKDVHVSIPLGTEGTFGASKYTVIGFMERYTMYEGRAYPWSEYLLYNSDLGFRWLVESDRHWTFVESVSASDVKSTFSSAVKYGGQKYRLFDKGTAFVRHVLGEFYWKVQIGETVQTADYIAPPHMLSVEKSFTTKSEEINYSHATYMTPEQVENAFGLKSGSLPKAWGVGPCQHAPDVGVAIFMLWPVFLFIIFVTHLMFSRPGSTSGSSAGVMFFAMVVVSLFPVGVIMYQRNFEVRRWADSDYSPYATDD